MWGVADVLDECWGVTDNCVFHVKTQLDKVKVAQSCPTLRDPMDYTVHLPNPGIEPRSPALQVDSLPAEPQGKPPVG